MYLLRMLFLDARDKNPIEIVSEIVGSFPHVARIPELDGGWIWFSGSLRSGPMFLSFQAFPSCSWSQGYWHETGIGRKKEEREGQYQPRKSVFNKGVNVSQNFEHQGLFMCHGPTLGHVPSHNCQQDWEIEGQDCCKWLWSYATDWSWAHCHCTQNQDVGRKKQGMNTEQ